MSFTSFRPSILKWILLVNPLLHLMSWTFRSLTESVFGTIKISTITALEISFIGISSNDPISRHLWSSTSRASLCSFDKYIFLATKGSGVPSNSHGIPNNIQDANIVPQPIIFHLPTAAPRRKCSLRLRNLLATIPFGSSVATTTSGTSALAASSVRAPSFEVGVKVFSQVSRPSLSIRLPIWVT